ncbi:MAG TPA: glycosyltransferase family 2 protein [Anaerolineae bacterium]|nr:glycosyltransferase family 2 protein [Anaerolineae bacterium]
MEKKANLISIVIPAYNEEEAIGEDLDLIRATMEASGHDYEVIVVDDGSTDRTAEIVRQRPWVRMIQHPHNRGVGAARTTGVKAARGDVIVMTDGDGTYPNQDIPRLLAAMDRYDMVIGARKREAGSLPWLRAPTKHFIRLLASYLAETHIPDPNSGFRAFRREIALRFLDILPRGHSWVATITLAFLSEDHLVTFIPIDYYKRKGRSTFHPLTDTYNYLSLVVRTIMYFNPLRVFLPTSLFLIVVAAIKLIRDFIVYRGPYVPGVTLMLVLTAIQVGAIGLLADLIVKRSKS